MNENHDFTQDEAVQRAFPDAAARNAEQIRRIRAFLANRTTPAPEPDYTDMIVDEIRRDGWGGETA